MLLEVGVADAYGAVYEGCSSGFIERNNDMNYERHPRTLKERPEDLMPSLVPPGAYTDDTQMMIAIVEAMLDEDDWTEENLADRFVEVFHRDQRRGYTTGFLNILLNSHSGAEMLSKIGGKSTKSGAAMRVGPIGLYRDTEEVIDRAAIQANVTHDSTLGRNSSICAALMVHYLWHDLGPKEDMVDWLNEQMSGMIHSEKPFYADGELVEVWTPQRKKVRCHAWDVVEAAIYAIEEHDNLKDILWQCVAYCGDTDTTAAVAMAAASCSGEIKQNLPQNLIDKLENKEYGRDYLKKLDEDLLGRFSDE